MPPTSSTSSLSFDEHADQALALFLDDRPCHATPSQATRQRLVLVTPTTRLADGHRREAHR
ncbi:hypothetical protein ACWEQL_20155 [Kitasatospora sp. NPDC004240]